MTVNAPLNKAWDDENPLLDSNQDSDRDHFPLSHLKLTNLFIYLIYIVTENYSLYLITVIAEHQMVSIQCYQLPIHTFTFHTGSRHKREFSQHTFKLKKNLDQYFKILWQMKEFMIILCFSPVGFRAVVNHHASTFHNPQKVKCKHINPLLRL